MDCDGGLGEEAAYQSVAEYEAWAKATIAARDAELAALRKQVEFLRKLVSDARLMLITKGTPRTHPWMIHAESARAAGVEVEGA